LNVELIGLTQYLRGDGRAESLTEHAGRVCYRSEPRGNPAAFIRARLRDGHESIIEHASATFEVSGLSRVCSHQLVRHRLASYSQESQRYVDLSEPEMVIPPSIEAQPEARAIWDRLVGQMAEAYRDLRALGINKEDARFLLPNATATRIVVTMNFRELLHFFRVRIHPAAQWEIRDLAMRMLRLVAIEAPAVFGDLLAELSGKYPQIFDAAS
jgi:thymidylate synthase (FAD)